MQDGILRVMPTAVTLSAAGVQKALKYAKKAHSGQMRSSGEPYFAHLSAVADLLKQLGADHETLMAAYLHDTVEDTAVTYEDIRKEFGTPVAKLVEGVTKVEQLEYRTDKKEQNMHAIRKMFRTMGKDIRVIFIKLADRLHNMRTLAHVPHEKQLRVARETQDIYCPLADLLGMRTWYQELSDQCFRILYPTEYDLVQRMAESMKQNQLKRMEQWIKVLQQFYRTNNWRSVTVNLERRHMRSVYDRMMSTSTSLQQIEIFHHMHIVIPDSRDCYAALGLLHQFATPIPGFFDDYVVTPKINGYQALHTRVHSPSGNVIDVIIQTQKMANQSRDGLAIIYQQGTANYRSALPDWIETLTSLEENEQDLQEFFNMIQEEVFGENKRIQVMNNSKKKRNVDVPADATLLDVAYYLREKDAAHLKSASVNSKPASLSLIVNDGDVVSLHTTPNVFHRLPRDLYLLNTSLGQKLLLSQLAASPPKVQIERGKECIFNAVDIAIDPFFGIQWKKQIRERIEQDKQTLVNVGKGIADPFTYLEDISMPEDYFLLDPLCLLGHSRLLAASGVHFVLRTSIEDFRKGNIIGLQSGPDTIEVLSADVLLEERRFSKEFIPLRINKELAGYPLYFALRCTFERNANPLSGISMLQNLVDAPVKLLRLEDNSFTLNFNAYRIRTVHVAYQHLFRLPYIADIFRITPS